MGGGVGSRDLDFWCLDSEIPLWARTRSRHEIDVTIYVSLQEGRDLEMKSRPGLGLGRGKRSRDLALRSRPGSACLRSQPGLEVATWPRQLGHLVSRPGCWVAIGQA